jgi:dihydrofolate reductase
MTLPLVIVVAVAENGVIGKDNNLSWRMPSDLKHFRAITMGKPLIIGRRTFQSIGRPLPGREIVVVTLDPSFAAPGIHVAHSLDAAVAEANKLAVKMGASEIVAAGGGSIYAALLPCASAIELTRVHATIEGDTHFPSLDEAEWRKTRHEERSAGPGDDFAYALIRLERRQ